MGHEHMTVTMSELPERERMDHLNALSRQGWEVVSADPHFSRFLLRRRLDLPAADEE